MREKAKKKSVERIVNCTRRRSGILSTIFFQLIEVKRTVLSDKSPAQAKPVDDGKI